MIHLALLNLEQLVDIGNPLDAVADDEHWKGKLITATNIWYIFDTFVQFWKRCKHLIGMSVEFYDIYQRMFADHWPGLCITNMK